MKLAETKLFEIENAQYQKPQRWNKPFVDRAKGIDRQLFCRCASCGEVVTKDLRNSINELVCEECQGYEQAERERANLMGK